jgi:hypothetical protein
MAEKDKGGRPLKFKTKQALEERINEYFNSCFEPAFTKSGEPMIDFKTGEQMMWQSKPFTMSGLAYYLDIDRKTLYNYGKKEKFFPTIKRAKARVEAYVEEQLFRPQIAAGVIFNLKNNFGWCDNPSSESQNTEDKVADKLNEVFGNVHEETN